MTKDGGHVMLTVSLYQGVALRGALVLMADPSNVATLRLPYEPQRIGARRPGVLERAINFPIDARERAV